MVMVYHPFSASTWNGHGELTDLNLWLKLCQILLLSRDCCCSLPRVCDIDFDDPNSLEGIFSRVLRDSTPRFIGPSVRPSVRPSHFTFLGVLRFLASLLLPK